MKTPPHPTRQTPVEVSHIRATVFTGLSCDRYGYEAELLALLEQLVRDMDRKIERQKERAIKDNAPREPNSSERAELQSLQAREKGVLPLVYSSFTFTLW